MQPRSRFPVKAALLSTLVLLALLPSVCKASSVFEQVADLLPGGAHVVIVPERSVHVDPRCDEEIEGDWTKDLTWLHKKLERDLNDKQNRGKYVAFDDWGEAVGALQRNEREDIATEATQQGATHVLFFRVRSTYEWTPQRGDFTRASQTWTLTLVSTRDGSTRTFTGGNGVPTLIPPSLPVHCANQ